jgi:Domain of unknown function (DUF6484)
MSAASHGMAPSPPPTGAAPDDLTAAELSLPRSPNGIGAEGASTPRPAVTSSGRQPTRARRSSRGSQQPTVPGAVVIGTFVGVGDAGEPLVDHPLNPSGHPLASRTIVPLGQDRLGQEVVLAFEGGDPGRPIVLGVVLQGGEPPPASTDASGARPAPPLEARIDGEQLILTAEKEIVLRCGEASITLTRAGKVLIRGTYLLSRSSGVNRIKGGSVQIN